jgi:hypothetical protein
VLVGTDTVTAQGPPAVDLSTRSGDFYPATTEDLELATSGDLLMAMDSSLTLHFASIGRRHAANR